MFAFTAAGGAAAGAAVGAFAGPVGAAFGAIGGGVFGGIVGLGLIAEDEQKKQRAKKPSPIKKLKQKKAPKKQVKPDQPVNLPVIEHKEDMNDEYRLKKMLVVIICVGEYDGALDNLPGTQKDLLNLVLLFSQYEYEIFATKEARVTYDQMDLLLNKARTEFMENEYDGVIVCFSGHGDKDSLFCSDFDGRGNGKFPRQDFNQWFDGNNCKSRIDKYKFYFLDACRGGQMQNIIPIKQDVNVGIRARGNMARSELKNASENTCYMYGNSNWSPTLETKSGGMLISAVVEAFTLNLEKSMGIGPLQSKIRKIAKGYGNDKDGVILPTIESNIDHEDAGKITFAINTKNIVRQRGFTENIKTTSMASDDNPLENDKDKFAIKAVDNGILIEGGYARLKGLMMDPTFNGKKVKIMHFVKKRNRWKVQLLNHGYMAVREENLEPLKQGTGIVDDINAVQKDNQIENDKVKSTMMDTDELDHQKGQFNTYNYWKSDYSYYHDQDLPDI